MISGASSVKKVASSRTRLDQGRGRVSSRQRFFCLARPRRDSLDAFLTGPGKIGRCGCFYNTVYGMRALFFPVSRLVLVQTPSVALFGDDAADRHGITFFEKMIRPVFVEHCYECHSSNVKEVEKSLLISAIRHEKLEMPPSGKLPDHLVADLVKWIEIGAPDPRDGVR